VASAHLRRESLQTSRSFQWWTLPLSEARGVAFTTALYPPFNESNARFWQVAASSVAGVLLQHGAMQHLPWRI
jgi:hypothetical protein